MLTDVKLRNLKKPGKHFDGAGLYLEITPAGGRYWRLKYRFAGKEKRLAFGVYPEVTLAEARQRTEAARRVLRDGVDPSVEKRTRKLEQQAKALNTFEAVARDWLEHSKAKWTPTTKAQILASLERGIFPTLGARPIADIRPGEVAAAVKAIEKRGAGETAGRVLQRVRAVFRFAAGNERLGVNPMAEIKPGEILKPRQVTHRAALPAKELPAFLKRFAAYDGDPHTINAMKLLILTTVRPGEVRGARWDEVDTSAKQWRIPAERMKMRVEHIIPLSRQALDVFEVMRPLTGTRELIFPSPYYPTKSLSENTFNSALARMGYKGYATAHGFRALFSTVANESGWDADVVERQLAHIEGNKVRAAYHRATYLGERAELMQWWADFLDAKSTGSKVIPIRGGKAA